MHFDFEAHDTIAAIVTAIGESGVAIIRISGIKALEIADKVFSAPLSTAKNYTMVFGNIINPIDNSFIDHALALIMKSPTSFTGENVIELQCHGGCIAPKKVLEVVLKAGARQAQPGEFSYRAFLNGKIDLVQAESIRMLIHAKNEAVFNSAASSLQGKLSQKILLIRDNIIKISSSLEIAIDFSDQVEDSSRDATYKQTSSLCLQVMKDIEYALDVSKQNDKNNIKTKICLFGLPNAGKSSLMNALLEEERAIVSNEPGTTRDFISEELFISGKNILLTDTAGVRKNATSNIETQGIHKAINTANNSNIILLVVDGTIGITSELDILPESYLDNTILVWNKSDLDNCLPMPNNFKYAVNLSAKTNEGLIHLKQTIDLITSLKPSSNINEDNWILSHNNENALKQTLQHLQEAYNLMSSFTSEEIVLFEIRDAIQSCNACMGNNISEDILSNIFSNFCIGK